MPPVRKSSQIGQQQYIQARQISGRTPSSQVPSKQSRTISSIRREKAAQYAASKEGRISALSKQFEKKDYTYETKTVEGNTIVEAKPVEYEKKYTASAGQKDIEKGTYSPHVLEFDSEGNLIKEIAYADRYTTTLVYTGYRPGSSEGWRRQYDRDVYVDYVKEYDKSGKLVKYEDYDPYMSGTESTNAGRKETESYGIYVKEKYNPATGEVETRESPRTEFTGGGWQPYQLAPEPKVSKPTTITYLTKAKPSATSAEKLAAFRAAQPTTKVGAGFLTKEIQYGTTFDVKKEEKAEIERVKKEFLEQKAQKEKQKDIQQEWLKRAKETVIKIEAKEQEESLKLQRAKVIDYISPESFVAQVGVEKGAITKISELEEIEKGLPLIGKKEEQKGLWGKITSKTEELFKTIKGEPIIVKETIIGTTFDTEKVKGKLLEPIEQAWYEKGPSLSRLKYLVTRPRELKEAEKRIVMREIEVAKIKGEKTMAGVKALIHAPAIEVAEHPVKYAAITAITAGFGAITPIIAGTKTAVILAKASVPLTAIYATSVGARVTQKFMAEPEYYGRGLTGYAELLVEPTLEVGAIATGVVGGKVLAAKLPEVAMKIPGIREKVPAKWIQQKAEVVRAKDLEVKYAKAISKKPATAKSVKKIVEAVGIKPETQIKVIRTKVKGYWKEIKLPKGKIPKGVKVVYGVKQPTKAGISYPTAYKYQPPTIRYYRSKPEAFEITGTAVGKIQKGIGKKTVEITKQELPIKRVIDPTKYEHIKTEGEFGLTLKQEYKGYGIRKPPYYTVAKGGYAQITKVLKPTEKVTSKLFVSPIPLPPIKERILVPTKFAKPILQATRFTARQAILLPPLFELRGKELLTARQAITLAEAEKQGIKPIIEPISISDIGLGLKQKPLVETKPILAQAPIVEQAPIVKQKPLVKQKPIVETKPIVQLKPITELKYIEETTPIIKEPIIPPPPKFLKPTLPEQKVSPKFTVEVRRKGIFRPVGKYPSLKTALLRGRGIVEKTAAASFRVRGEEGGLKIGATAWGLLPREKFRPSKKEPGIFVQKREFRISTPGEKREITYKGLLKQRLERGKKKKNVFDIFGG